jgi:hypothetical protein
VFLLIVPWAYINYFTDLYYPDSKNKPNGGNAGDKKTTDPNRIINLLFFCTLLPSGLIGPCFPWFLYRFKDVIVQLLLYLGISLAVVVLLLLLSDNKKDIEDIKDIKEIKEIKEDYKKDIK